MNKLAHIARRAFGGIRRRPWMHVVSIVTLAAAFLSFAATLTAALNLDALIVRWVGSAELTVYLEEDSLPEDLDKLATAVAAIDGVASVSKVTRDQAKERFLEDLGIYGEMGEALPGAAFPASMDVRLKPALSRSEKERGALASRLEKVDMVGEVEIYDDWFERLSALSLIGRLAAWGLGLLALVVSVLVVAATVRAGVTARRKEIEVLRFVGATDRYVRLPFLLEGAVEALAAMLLALLALHFIMNKIELIAGDILPLVGGGDIVRLGMTLVGVLLLGGLFTGFLGARLSLRRLEEA